MNSLHRFFRHKSHLARLLLAIFVANILATSTGISAPLDWLEHEKSHYVAVGVQMSTDLPDSTPVKPADQKQNKHESHASHFFKADLATPSVAFFLPAEPLRLTISYLIPTLREISEPPFRPPQ